MTDDDLEAIEIDLLLEAAHRRYGYDFRGYARPTMRRRVWKRALAENLRTLTSLTEKILHDPECMDRLLVDLTIHVTSMFRDPGFYQAFRDKVLPHLRTYPFVRIWHAGCSSGEEVYSLAILLKESNIHDRCRIYATDVDAAVVKKAAEGVFPLDAMREYTANYLKAGGARDFSEYYTAMYDRAIFRADLRDNIVFSQHNLVSDASFNEFNVILCRNVLIYFTKPLQDRVFTLFHDSLAKLGVLALGKKESMRLSPHEKSYEELDGPERIFRKAT